MNTDYVDNFENYDRKLIKLNSDTAILLHIFKKKLNHHFEDWMVLQDNEEYFKKECIPHYEDAARQFVKRFEGEECMAFVIALKNELERMIQEDEYKRNKAKRLPEGGDNPSEKCPD